MYNSKPEIIRNLLNENVSYSYLIFKYFNLKIHSMLKFFYKGNIN